MVDTCVCCGEIVPEGRMVCKNCELLFSDQRSVRITDNKKNFKTIIKQLWRRN